MDTAEGSEISGHVPETGDTLKSGRAMTDESCIEANKRLMMMQTRLSSGLENL